MFEKKTPLNNFLVLFTLSFSKAWSHHASIHITSYTYIILSNSTIKFVLVVKCSQLRENSISIKNRSLMPIVELNHAGNVM